MNRTSAFFIPILLAVTLQGEPGTHFDGPYVSYSNDQVYVKYIVQDGGSKQVRFDSMNVSERKNIVLTVNTDIPGKTFQVKLKDKLEPAASEFPAPAKTLVISDLEGNFSAFTNLLLGNGVIDTAFNWTFGNNHLVLTGDFVDRGELVTELLWLIYSLEDKATTAGGHVHYVLGNHEIMIMSGDTRYINKKYKETAGLLQSSYQALFDEHAELGRWLRTKNVMEKVGEDVFVHGGISDEVNKLRMSLPEINSLVRPYYADTSAQLPDKKLNVLYSDLGPFWYRGFYQADPEQLLPAQINKSLSRFKAKHIFTGHSIVGDTVSVWFNGKLINTDVHHAEGKTEGVLIEGGQYYRVMPAGARIVMGAVKK